MAAPATPPPAAIRRGIGMTVLFVIVMLVLGFVAGAYIGPRYGFGYRPPTTQLTTVVAGTNTPFPPFEYRNTTTQALIGLDIDLVNEIGARNGWNVVWRDYQDWDTLLFSIQYRGVDIGASSITSSGDTGRTRNATMAFSQSYYLADQAVLVKTGFATAPTCPGAQCTANGLANHTVAVQTLTSSYNWVEANLVAANKTPSSMVHDFGDLNSVVQELVNGRVDFVLVDKPIAQNFVKSNSALAIAGPIITNEQYSFAVAHGDPGGFLAKINSALDSMKADGTFQKIMDKWLT